MAGYLSIREADKMFAKDIYYFEIWAALNDAAKEQYIAFASTYVDKYRPFLGSRVRDDQDFEFPRNFENVWENSNNFDLYYKNHKKIPIEVKRATFEAIKQVYKQQDYQSIIELKNLGVSSFSDGLMSFSTSDPKDILPSDILLEILPFTSIGNRK